MKSIFRKWLGVSALALAAATLGSPAQAQFQDRTIRVSNGVSKEHPMANGLAVASKCTAERSGGKLKVVPYFDGVLGSDLNATQSVRTGSLEMVLTSTAPVATIVPAMGVFDLPFLFNDEAEADKLLDGAVGKWFSDKLPPIGAVNLTYWENGFRHTTNSRRPITKVEDFQGIKMRVMQNNIYIDTFKELGSNAVPMAFSEVYSALETKTVDGQENPYNNIENMKFFEVQKFLTLTKHAYSPTLVLLSTKVWDSMSADERKTMTECFEQGRTEQRRVSRIKAEESLANLKSKGMQVNEIAPAEMARIREKLKVINDRHSTSIGKEAMDLVFNELKKLRGS